MVLAGFFKRQWRGVMSNGWQSEAQGKPKEFPRTVESAIEYDADGAQFGFQELADSAQTYATP